MRDDLETTKALDDANLDAVSGGFATVGTDVAFMAGYAAMMWYMDQYHVPFPRNN